MAIYIMGMCVYRTAAARQNRLRYILYISYTVYFKYCTVQVLAHFYSHIPVKYIMYYRSERVKSGSNLTYHNRSWIGSNKCKFDSARPRPAANCRSPPLAFLAPSKMAFAISLLMVSESRVRHL